MAYSSYKYYYIVNGSTQIHTSRISYNSPIYAPSGMEYMWKRGNLHSYARAYNRCTFGYTLGANTGYVEDDYFSQYAPQLQAENATPTLDVSSSYYRAKYDGYAETRYSNITVKVNNNNYGDIKYSSSYYNSLTVKNLNSTAGSSIYVTAVPAWYCDFTGWSDGSTSKSRTLYAAYNDTTYTANFQPKPQYTINISSEDTLKGTVAGGGTYYRDETVYLYATPKTSANYCTTEFDGWYEGSTRVSTSTTYSFTVTKSRTLVAKFRRVNYYVVVSMAGYGKINVNVDGTVTTHENTLNADDRDSDPRANAWSDDYTHKQYVVRASGKSITFSIPDSHSKYARSWGVWSKSDGHYIHRSDHAFTFTPAESNIHAENNRVYVVARFYKANLLTVSSSPKELGFISIDDSGGDSTSSTVSIIEEKQNRVLKAIPKSNVNFAKWTEDGATISTDIETTITTPLNSGVKNDRTILAVFGDVLIQVNCNMPDNANYYLEDDVSNKTYYYASGNTATAYCGVKKVSTHMFVGWYADSSYATLLSPNQTYQFVADTSKTIYAKVLERSLNVFAQSGEYNDDGTWQPTDTHIYGEVCILSSNGENLGTSYIPKQHETIVLKATKLNPTIDGEISVGAFVGWYLNGLFVSGQSEYSFIPNKDGEYEPTEYVARFTQATPYTLTRFVGESPDDTEQDETIESYLQGCRVQVSNGFPFGELNEKGEYDQYYSGEVTLTALPGAGWRLAAWAVDGSGYNGIVNDEDNKPITTNNFTISLAGNTKVVAIFTLKTYKMTCTVDSYSMGMGDISLESGDMMADTVGDPANPIHGSKVRVLFNSTVDGSVLRRVVDNGTTVLVENNMYEITVTTDHNIVAYWGSVLTTTSNKEEYIPYALASTSIGGTYSNTCDFTFGDTIYLKAISDEGRYFQAWYNMLNEDQPLGSIPAEGSVSEMILVNPSYKAVFTEELKTYFVRLTNLGSLLGDLSLESATGEGVQEISSSEFAIGMENESGLPTYTGIGSLGSDIPFGIDKFYRVTQNTPVTITTKLKDGDRLTSFNRWNIGAYMYSDNLDVVSNDSQVGTDTTLTFSISQHVRISAYYNTAQPTLLKVFYQEGSNQGMGKVDILPHGDDTIESALGIQSVYVPGEIVTLVAKPLNGYKFSGWYDAERGGNLISTLPKYELKVESAARTFYAKFIQDAEAVYRWAGSDSNKIIEWRSKRFSSSQPINLVCGAVHSENYNNVGGVVLRTHYATSPNPTQKGWKTTSIVIGNQEPRRLPMTRPEKFVEVEVQSGDEVTKVSVSSSMGGLVQ